MTISFTAHIIAETNEGKEPTVKYILRLLKEGKCDIEVPDLFLHDVVIKVKEKHD